VVSLLIERQPILKIKYKIQFFNLILNNIDGCHYISFFSLWGWPHVILLEHWLLEIVTWSTSHRMINFYFWSPCHFISWFNRDWHLVIYDPSWLIWFVGLNIHLPFSITFGTSTPRLRLSLLRCMVHHDQDHVNPSSTNILSHTSLHVLHRLILENLILMIKFLP
jgi:hypothetical protein